MGSYMIKVAKMLGVELEEVFSIKHEGAVYDSCFKLTEFGLAELSDNTGCWSMISIDSLLNGYDEIIKRRRTNMDNRMAEVAKIFGLELGESFKITSDTHGDYQNYYRFTENNCLETSDDGVEWKMITAEVLLKRILMGNIRIIKLPWKPRIREKYYVPRIAIRSKDRYYWYHWQNSDADIKRYDMGIVCNTKEEAIALTEKMLVAIKEE